MSSPSKKGERTLIVDPQGLISVRDVMARWAYSEMVGAHFSPLYSTDPCVDAIKGKRSAGILFDQLSDMERNILFAEWSRVRSFFAQFLEGVRGYRIEQWHRHQLALARVTPGVDPKYRDYPLLSLFFLTSADHPTDPRNAARNAIWCWWMIPSRLGSITGITSSSMVYTGRRGSSHLIFQRPFPFTCRFQARAGDLCWSAIRAETGVSQGANKQPMALTPSLG
jgi:hypothetical protein